MNYTIEHISFDVYISDLELSIGISLIAEPNIDYNLRKVEKLFQDSFPNIDFKLNPIMFDRHKQSSVIFLVQKKGRGIQLTRVYKAPNESTCVGLYCITNDNQLVLTLSKTPKYENRWVPPELVVERLKEKLYLSQKVRYIFPLVIQNDYYFLKQYENVPIFFHTNCEKDIVEIYTKLLYFINESLIDFAEISMEKTIEKFIEDKRISKNYFTDEFSSWVHMLLYDEMEKPYEKISEDYLFQESVDDFTLNKKDGVMYLYNKSPLTNMK